MRVFRAKMNIKHIHLRLVVVVFSLVPIGQGLSRRAFLDNAVELVQVGATKSTKNIIEFGFIWTKDLFDLSVFGIEGGLEILAIVRKLLSSIATFRVVREENGLAIPHVSIGG